VDCPTCLALSGKLTNRFAMALILTPSMLLLNMSNYYHSGQWHHSRQKARSSFVENRFVIGADVCDHFYWSYYAARAEVQLIMG